MPDVVLKLYHNQNGQLRALQRYRPDLNTGTYKKALREFTKGEQLWDIVDVGEDEQAADKKIVANLYRHCDDKACAKIFLAGTHDTGYAEHLKRLASVEGMSKKITLITAWTTRPEFMRLPFEVAEWDDIFAGRPLIVTHTEHPPPYRKGHKEIYNARRIYDARYRELRWKATPAWDGYAIDDKGEQDDGMGDEVPVDPDNDREEAQDDVHGDALDQYVGNMQRYVAFSECWDSC
jgi:hypothetical protein